jgi:membrane fusion protein, multidrug efflux system
MNERNQADFARYQTLFDKQEVARADYDQYKATASAQVQTVASNQAAVASAQKTVEQRMSQLAQQRSKLQQTQSSAPLQVAIRQADIKSQQANAEAAQAALEQSRLNLGYCRITAPVSGVITQRSAEVGARISKGQQLFMIVQTDDLWVTANFKETQLARIHPGQLVRIHVDALHDDFDGTIESMPAITGSRASVLPPENATGNYVKVIQRLPVRIRFNQGQKDLDKLRPGMSVEPKVHLD